MQSLCSRLLLIILLNCLVVQDIISYRVLSLIRKVNYFLQELVICNSLEFNYFLLQEFSRNPKPTPFTHHSEVLVGSLVTQKFIESTYIFLFYVLIFQYRSSRRAARLLRLNSSSCVNILRTYKLYIWQTVRPSPSFGPFLELVLAY